MRKLILLYLYCIIVYGSENLTSFANSEEVDSGHSGIHYGKSWILMPDGQGQLQVAILSKDVVMEEPSGFWEHRPTVETVEFCLYTSKHPTKCKRLETGNKYLLKLSGINSRVPTKVVTHGWKSSGQCPTCLSIKDAYLSKGHYNVLIVDWTKIAGQEYFKAAEDTAPVATYTAKLIDFLMTSAGLRAEDIHLIGHSLGAHIAGMIGKRIIAGPVARISGLDPARPLFELSLIFSNRDRLSKDQATFVDVIHTSGGTLGFLERLGHADFYPNGGIAPQPGCFIMPCSHSRAWQYFAESVNSSIPFMAVNEECWNPFDECETITASMGDPTPSNTRGKFYLKTRDKKPYAIG